MNHTELSPETVIDFLADLFDRRGADAYLGEPVTMSQHMLQAAQLAEQEGAIDALIVAALLHDVGHFTSELPADAYIDRIDNRHEQAGAEFLGRFFSPQVSEPIRLHVNAKRYLCAVDKDYFGCLSDASVLSLQMQGGPMSPKEAAEFSTNPYSETAVRLRRWDDSAKEPECKTRDFGHYRDLLERLLVR